MLSRVFLFIAVLLAFGASVTHGFHFDDYSIIHGAPWSAWRTRPLTSVSFLMSARLSSNPALWHLVSLAAHFAAVLLLYQLLLRFMTPMAALIAAVVFGVHPIQAESVAYVYSRSTLFSTALSVATCLLWLKRRRWFAVACFGTALIAKEDCVTLPLVIFLAELPTIRDKLLPIGSMLLLSMMVTLNTLLATRLVSGSGAGFSAGVSPLSYFLNEGYVILGYLWLVLIPYGFTIDPEFNITPSRALVSWILVTGLIGFAVWKRQRWFLAGLFLLIPTSSIFPLADLAADHRMYLPMAAFAGCAGLWLEKLPRYASLLIIFVLISVSATRMNVWASDVRLWSEAVDRAPDKLRPRLQLSRALEPRPALLELRATQLRFPERPEVDEELGRVYLQMGQPATALAEFGKVLGKRPGNPHAINNRGVALRALGQEDAAKQDFARALKINPCLAEARQNLSLQPCR